MAHWEIREHKTPGYWSDKKGKPISSHAANLPFGICWHWNDSKGGLMLYVEDEERSDKPCWIGFSRDMDRDKNKIPMSYQEEDAARWILMGWDVGYLPKGLNNAEEVKWLT